MRSGLPLLISVCAFQADVFRPLFFGLSFFAGIIPVEIAQITSSVIQKDPSASGEDGDPNRKALRHAQKAGGEDQDPAEDHQDLCDSFSVHGSGSFPGTAVSAAGPVRAL